MASSSLQQSDEYVQRTKRKHYKDARLVVRNLSFACKEEDVLNHFSKFGTVEEVTLLRKSGRLIGCGFVQFSKKNDAAKALSKTSGETFLGRPVIVDWAVPKNKFHFIKCEKEQHISTATTSSPKLTVRHKRKHEKKAEHEPKKLTQDVLDGKTVFLKDIPFQASNEHLKKCAEESAGPVEYAVICTDPLSEHSKGTGFIRFKDKDVADKVLNNEKQLFLFGKQLSVHKMLAKEDLVKKQSDKTVPKDKRNLYLIKEGVILAGSLAAKSVSQSDMSKRLLLEQQRSKELRNLHKFISPTRLVIYNLPLRNFDNKRLLALFKSHSPKDAVITEARVMRNLNNFDEKGLPISKGYGYVSFEKHQDALTALRSVNNNPNIFSEKKRPIVSFSIEDKKALLLKKRRQEKSLTKNHKNEKFNGTNNGKTNNVSSKSEDNLTPRCNEIASGFIKTQTSISQLSQTSQKFKTKKKPKNSKNSSVNVKSSSSASFVGLPCKVGNTKLRSRRKLCTQAALHKINVKKEQLKQIILKKRLSRKQKRMKNMAI